MKKLLPEAKDRLQRIRELADYREDYTRKKGLPLSLKHLCHKLRIYPSTVKQLAPELYEKWNDLSFHWKVPRQ